MSFYNPSTVFSATIADTETTSEDVSLGGLRAWGVNVPSATASANITFEVSADGTTWHPLYKEDNTELSIAITATAAIGFGELIIYFAAWPHVRIIGDVAASGDEDFEIVARDI